MNELAPKYQEKAVKWEPIDVQVLAGHNLYKPDNWPFAWLVQSFTNNCFIVNYI